jgi:hypothetical protein
MLAHDGRRWRAPETRGCQGRHLREKGGGFAGIWSERVEAWGGGRSYDLDTCGRLGRRDERTQGVLQYISRSLVSALAVFHSVSRWRRPAARVGNSIC